MLECADQGHAYTTSMLDGSRARATLTGVSLRACIRSILNALLMMIAWTGFTGSYAADMYAPAQPVARGSILVASDSLLDPRFARSVVLITDYGVDGAVGVILNRPTLIRVVDAIPVLDKLLHHPDKTMYFGGPVAPNTARVLIAAGEALLGATRIVDGVYGMDRMSVLLPYFEEEEFAPRTRFYGGYAGWGAGQLQQEIQRGDWIVIEGDATTIFSDTVDTLWKDLSARFSGLWVLLEAL